MWDQLKAFHTRFDFGKGAEMKQKKADLWPRTRTSIPSAAILDVCFYVSPFHLFGQTIRGPGALWPSAGGLAPPYLEMCSARTAAFLPTDRENTRQFVLNQSICRTLCCLRRSLHIDAQQLIGHWVKTLIHALSSIAASLVNISRFGGVSESNIMASRLFCEQNCWWYSNECAPSIHPICFLLRRRPHITQHQREYGW